MASVIFGRLALRVAALAGPRRSLGREEGQTLVEYTLILFVVGMGVLVALSFLRDQLSDFFTTVGNTI
jgi:Flp pilus assembly pilin Flp